MVYGGFPKLIVRYLLLIDSKKFFLFILEVVSCTTRFLATTDQ